MRNNILVLLAVGVLIPIVATALFCIGYFGFVQQQTIDSMRPFDTTSYPEFTVPGERGQQYSFFLLTTNRSSEATESISIVLKNPSDEASSDTNFVHEFYRNGINYEAKIKVHSLQTTELKMLLSRKLSGNQSVMYVVENNNMLWLILIVLFGSFPIAGIFGWAISRVLQRNRAVN